MKTYATIIKESPSEYSANLSLAQTEKLRPGHYLKRGNSVISKRYDNPDHALMAWRSLPSHAQAGVVVKHIKEEAKEISEEAEFIEEGHVENHIQQVLADRDINSEIKGGKLVVNRSNLAKAKYHVKKLGHTISIVGGLNESESHTIIRDKLAGMHSLKTLKIPTPEERRAQIAKRKADEEKNDKPIKEATHHVEYVDREYQTKKKKFIDAADGAPDNGLKRAKEYIKKIENAHEKSQYGTIRGAVKLRTEQIENNLEVLESALLKLEQDDVELSNLTLDELTAYAECEEFIQLDEEIKEQLVEYISTLTK